MKLKKVPPLLTVGLIFSSLVFFSGCELLNFRQEDSPDEAQPLETLRPVVRGDLLAQVNDWAIGTSDLRDYVDNLEPLAQAQGISTGSSEFKRLVLNDLVTVQILSQIARERGIHKTEEIRRGLVDFKNSLLANELRSQIDREVHVPFAEVESFYQQNKNLLTRPEEINIKELAVDDRQLANEIHIRLLQGESFSSLADEFSVLESAGDGGDLGYLDYDPEIKFPRFWEMVLALEAGETSSVFRGPGNRYYLIKVENVRGGQEIALSEVEDDLREALRASKIERKVTSIIEEFAERSDILINEHLLD